MCLLVKISIVSIHELNLCGVNKADKLELRIHEETERGDNDTVNMPNGQKVVIDGKTCADR